jgi:hypothetical protein
VNAEQEWIIVEENAAKFRDKYTDWRLGQSLFNALHMYDALVANTIRGTKYDCFNSDARIEIFKARAIELFESR